MCQKEPREETCDVCRFSQDNGVAGHECHRYPSTIGNAFPDVKPTDWCGEFELDVKKWDAMLEAEMLEEEEGCVECNVVGKTACSEHGAKDE